MKILYTNFHPRNGGGHVTYILNLARGLALEHEVTIATPPTSRLYRYGAALAGVKVAGMTYTSRIGAWKRERAAMRALLDAGNFDIIHVNGSSDHRLVMLATLGMRKRPRIVFTKHNDHPLNSIGQWLRARLATDQAIAVSRYVADLLAHSPYERCGVSTVYHGIDTDFFSPPSASLTAGLRERLFGADAGGKLVLGSSGGTDFDKGWLDLVAGIASLPAQQRDQIRVLVAGDPPNEAKMSRVRELGMEAYVVFPGLLDDVRPSLAACDVGFVLSYREALSFACREVMALGLPALVSRVGGLPENVVDGADGWIVPPKSPQAIAAVLAVMLSDRARVTRMGLAAREKAVREFSLAGFVNATLAVYRKVLAAG